MLNEHGKVTVKFLWLPSIIISIVLSLILTLLLSLIS
jgi:hypothetical protein